MLRAQTRLRRRIRCWSCSTPSCAKRHGPGRSITTVENHYELAKLHSVPGYETLPPALAHHLHRLFGDSIRAGADVSISVQSAARAIAGAVSDRLGATISNLPHRRQALARYQPRAYAGIGVARLPREHRCDGGSCYRSGSGGVLAVSPCVPHKSDAQVNATAVF